MHTDGTLEDMIDYNDVDMIDRLDMTVHDVSGQIAAEVNNQGQWIDFLLENGWEIEDIARIIRG